MECYQQWLLDNGYGAVRSKEAVGGGCISEAQRLHLENGQQLFVKQLAGAPQDMFTAEAAGLQALAEPDVCRVPLVIHAESRFILLEDLGKGSPARDFWAVLGKQLADLHRQTRPEFGFTVNNYCGATPQQNAPDTEGHRFFGECRILPLAQQANTKGLLPNANLSAVERICSKLAHWIPDMPASLIHGDLWSGNVHCDKEGQPALIDPATYWGWAEAELAMTQLFGGFPQTFYASYAENSLMSRDWTDRAELYNLYHLLNHLLLFGASYLDGVQRIIQRYSD